MHPLDDAAPAPQVEVRPSRRRRARRRPTPRGLPRTGATWSAVTRPGSRSAAGPRAMLAKRNSPSSRSSLGSTPGQAAVVAHPRERRHRRSAAAPASYLPRVEVEGARLAARARRPAAPPARGRGGSRRKYAPPAAGRFRPSRRSVAGGTSRSRPAGRCEPVRVPAAARVAVAGAPDGEERRVVAVALLEQDVEGPLPPRSRSSSSARGSRGTAARSGPRGSPWCAAPGRGTPPA